MVRAAPALRAPADASGRHRAVATQVHPGLGGLRRGSGRLGHGSRRGDGLPLGRLGSERLRRRCRWRHGPRDLDLGLLVRRRRRHTRFWGRRGYGSRRGRRSSRTGGDRGFGDRVRRGLRRLLLLTLSDLRRIRKTAPEEHGDDEDHEGAHVLAIHTGAPRPQAKSRPRLTTVKRLTIVNPQGREFTLSSG